MSDLKHLKEQHKAIAEQLADAARKMHKNEYAKLFNSYVEELAKSVLMANRERALRVSSDGSAMYLRDKVGSYTSKDEAKRAISAIKRLNKESERRKEKMIKDAVDRMQGSSTQTSMQGAAEKDLDTDDLFHGATHG